MPGELGQGGGQVALVDAAETGEVPRAVDQQFIPDPARVSVHHAVLREIEIRCKISNHVIGIVGDAFALVMVDDRNDVAVNGPAVNRGVQ
jgi:hypothetical protein